MVRKLHIIVFLTALATAVMFPGTVLAQGPSDPPTIQVVLLNELSFQKALINKAGLKGWLCVAFDSDGDKLIDTISCKHKKTGVTLIIKKGKLPGVARGPHR